MSGEENEGPGDQLRFTRRRIYSHYRYDFIPALDNTINAIRRSSLLERVRPDRVTEVRQSLESMQRAADDMRETMETEFESCDMRDSSAWDPCSAGERLLLIKTRLRNGEKTVKDVYWKVFGALYPLFCDPDVPLEDIESVERADAYLYSFISDI